jgi:hypothetical protein
MNKNGLMAFGVLLLAIVAIVGGIVVFVPGAKKTGAIAAAGSSDPKGGGSANVAVVPPIQQELNDLSSKVIAQIKSEERLNLNMVAQLRSYQEMMRQIEGYASEIERNLDLIEEISKDEFQQDVKLQASLFSGKKASLVGKHLEEFRASRVGAILAKMKEKEAGAVLDTWAKQEDVKVAAFYREVMAAYLNNRRRDANPELFNKLGEDVKIAEKLRKQKPAVR